MPGFIPINVAGVAPAEDFVYPAGEYILAVDSAKSEPTKDGKGFRLVVKSKIVMGPGPSLDLQGKPFTHSFALTEKSRMFLVQFTHACGLEQMIAQNGGNIAEEWFAGKQYVAFISQKDGYFNAGKLRPLNAWTHGGIAGQPASAPQGGVAQPGLLQPMPGAPQAAPPVAQQPQAAPMAPQQGYAPQPGYAPQVQQPVPQQQHQQPVPGQPVQPQIPTPQAAPPFAPGNGAPVAQPGMPAPGVAPQAGMPAPPPPGQIPGQGQ